MDSDLISIQEARDLAANAQAAQRVWAKASQEDVDRVCAAMAQAAFNASAKLGQMAHDETGYGVPEHKKLKNEFGSRAVWESIKNIRTAGVINTDLARGITEIAWPVGVVAALTPSTNPTSTVMFKILISVKARDGDRGCPTPQCCELLRRNCQDHGSCRRRCRRPAWIGQLSRTCLAARYPGTDEPQSSLTHSGNRGNSHGARCPFCWQTRLRSRSRQCSCLCRPQRGY